MNLLRLPVFMAFLKNVKIDLSRQIEVQYQGLESLC